METIIDLVRYCHYINICKKCLKNRTTKSVKQCKYTLYITCKVDIDIKLFIPRSFANDWTSNIVCTIESKLC